MEGAYELLESAYALCRDTEGFEKTAAQLQEDFFAVGLAIDALEEGYDDFRNALSGIRFARYSGNKKADAETSDHIKDRSVLLVRRNIPAAALPTVRPVTASFSADLTSLFWAAALLRPRRLCS